MKSMVGTRRRLTEPPVGGEELPVKKEEEAMVVLDEEEGSQRCSLTREIAKLRERWELASVLNFLNVRIYSSLNTALVSSITYHIVFVYPQTIEERKRAFSCSTNFVAQMQVDYRFEM